MEYVQGNRGQSEVGGGASMVGKYLLHYTKEKERLFRGLSLQQALLLGTSEKLQNNFFIQQSHKQHHESKLFFNNETVSLETTKNCRCRLYFKSSWAGYWVKFSTSNNHASDKPHRLRYCHCAKLTRNVNVGHTQSQNTVIAKLVSSTIKRISSILC